MNNILERRRDFSPKRPEEPFGFRMHDSMMQNFGLENAELFLGRQRAVYQQICTTRRKSKKTEHKYKMMAYHSKCEECKANCSIGYPLCPIP
jgi:hypothetical protein